MKHTNISTGADPINGCPKTTENCEAKVWRSCLYLRISKEDGDKEESESITNQRSLLLNHAEKLSDIVIVDTKIDDGWSGASFQRPAFVEMMEDIRAGKIDCVLVKDLTRFGRNFGESASTLNMSFRSWALGLSA